MAQVKQVGMKMTSNFFHLLYNLIGKSLMIILGYEIDLQLLQVVLQLNWIVQHDDIKVCGFQIDFEKEIWSIELIG
jgi:hypothetical protein